VLIMRRFCRRAILGAAGGAISAAFASVFMLLAVAGAAPGCCCDPGRAGHFKPAGAATALVMNLSSNPFAALEIAFWLLGSLEDRSFRHVCWRCRS